MGLDLNKLLKMPDLSKLNLSGNNNISLLELIIISLIPLAPLYTRVVTLNGSLDKWYLIPFSVLPFPLSLIQTLPMYFGFVKPGNGNTKPYDWVMLFPIALRLIKSLIFLTIPSSLNHSIIINTISAIVSILCITYLNIRRRTKNCENNKNTTFMNSIPKSLINATTEYISGELFGKLLVLLISSLGMLAFPYNLIFNTIQGTLGNDMIQSIGWSILFILSYIIINMLNQDNLNVFCNSELSNFDNYKMIFTIIGIFSVVMLNYIKPDHIVKLVKSKHGKKK